MGSNLLILLLFAKSAVSFPNEFQQDDIFTVYIDAFEPIPAPAAHLPAEEKSAVQAAANGSPDVKSAAQSAANSIPQAARAAEAESDHESYSQQGPRSKKSLEESSGKADSEEGEGRSAQGSTLSRFFDVLNSIR